MSMQKVWVRKKIREGTPDKELNRDEMKVLRKYVGRLN